MRKIDGHKPAQTDQRLERARISVAKELGPWLQKLAHNYAVVGYLIEQGNYINSPATPENVKLTLVENYIRVCFEYLSSQNNIQQDALEDVRRMFRPLKYGFSIKSIQIAAKMFLEEYRSAINAAYQMHSFNWMNNEDILRLANVATATYIERWLETDRTAKKTIKAFSEYRYAEKPTDIDQKVLSRENPDEATILYRAYQKYNIAFQLRQEQEREEGTKLTTTPYKTSSGRALDIITLSWCDVWRKGSLQLWDILFFKRHFLNRKSDRDSAQNKTLCVALNSYRDLMNEIDQCYYEGNKDPAKYVEYVAKCMLVQKIERTCHFMLTTDVTKHALDNHLKPHAFNNCVSAAYLGRYSEMGGLFDSKNSFNKEGTRIYTISNDPLDVIYCENVLEIMANAYNNYQMPIEVLKETMRRRALKDLLVLLYTVFPVDKRHAWYAEDYIYAAKFYHEEYPFISEFCKKSFPYLRAEKQDEREKAHQYYDIYHQFYLQLYNMENSQIRGAVEKTKSKRTNDEE